MNNNDYTWFFIIITLINFSIGIDNNDKNIKQEQKQLELEKKIDKILELLDGRE